MEPDAKYRTAWRRLWAGLVDGAIFLPFGWLDDVLWRNVASPMVLVPWFVLYSFLMVGYSIGFHWAWGQTLGKRLAGVRVFNVAGGRLSFRQAALRDILPLSLTLVGVPMDVPKVAQGINPLLPQAGGLAGLSMFQMFVLWASLAWFVVEVVTMLSNRRRRALHDFIAGSVVMKVASEPVRRAEFSRGA